MKILLIGCGDPRKMPEANIEAVKNRFEVPRENIYAIALLGPSQAIACHPAQRDAIIANVMQAIDHFDTVVLSGHENCAVIPSDIDQKGYLFKGAVELHNRLGKPVWILWQRLTTGSARGPWSPEWLESVATTML